VPLYDLANTLPKSRAFFFDDVHFNDRGAHEAAAGLAAVVRQSLNGRVERAFK
jgi:hypothetical protein